MNGLDNISNLDSRSHHFRIGHLLMHHVNRQILHNHPGEILETMVSKKGACIMIYVKMVNVTQSFNFNLDTINKRDNQKLLNDFFPQNLPKTFKFFGKPNYIYCKLSRQ